MVLISIVLYPRISIYLLFDGKMHSGGGMDAEEGEGGGVGNRAYKL